MILTDAEKAILNGDTGTRGKQMAMEVVTHSARMLGAHRLVEVRSGHIDGCLYHGKSGTLYCERLAEAGARVAIPATTNVGALNLLKPDQCRLSPEDRRLAFRLMVAHERIGCTPSWTCAPYQAGARPGLGEQVAWGESNAVAFANTVLGARTNRYGDFLDIACAITGRAPDYGLHRAENRQAQIVLDVSGLTATLRAQSAFFPVLGAMIGQIAGESVCAVTGLEGFAPPEDDLKALCAGAAATGAVALVHLVGITPEAPDLKSATGDAPPTEAVQVTHDMVIAARDALSLAHSEIIDCVALGSPHFSEAECRAVLRLADGVRFAVPVYICLGRHTLESLSMDGADAALSALGVELVVDTCVVVTPILPEEPGAMMTNSAKFAHYATGNTGHAPVFGTLADCVASGHAGRVIRDPAAWH